MIGPVDMLRRLVVLMYLETLMVYCMDDIYVENYAIEHSEIGLKQAAKEGAK